MSRKILAEFDAIDGPFINKLRSIDNSVARFERGTLNAFGRVEKGLTGLLNSASQLRNFSGIVAGGFGLNQAAQFVDAATRIRNALREVSGGSETAFNDVYLAATRSLAGFEAFAQSAARMQKAVGGRQTFDETIRQMETLNKLMALGGKTTQERASTMIQFGQALQANVLQGEELRALRENAPIELMRAIAEEAGGTIENLKDLGSEGKLTTDVMVRALQRLEKEADLRLGNVVVTIGDAAVQMQNGAIVATEAFDKGLGLSRAAVVGLQTLGHVLGTNAEAFEMWGRIVQIALVAGIGAYAGGKLGAVGAALAESSAQARNAATATAALVRQEEQALVTGAMAERQARQRVESLRAQGASKRQLTAAIKVYDGAVITNSANLARYTAATNAAAAAQARLSVASRAAAASLRLGNAVLGFMGGWTGVFIAAATAGAYFYSTLETGAEKLARLSQNTLDTTSAADALVDVQNRLTDAIKATGSASDTTAQKILSDTKAEYEAKRKVLELDTQKLTQIQQERALQRVALRDRQNALLSEGRDLQSGFASASPDRRKIIAGQIAAINDELRVNEEAIIRMDGAYEETGAMIRRNLDLLAQSFAGLDSAMSAGASQEVLDALERVKKATEETMSAEQRHAAVMKELSDARAVLVAEMERTGDANGEIASQVDAVDAAMAAMRAEFASTASSANALTGAARTLAGALAGLGGVRLDLDGRLEGARAQLAASQARLGALRGGASEPQAAGAGAVAAEVSTILQRGGTADSVASVSGQLEGIRRSAEALAATEAGIRSTDDAITKLLTPPDQGGGGGGGGSNVLEDALGYIEQMMTAEERRAAEMRAMLETRKALVATYGAESEIVSRMDEAIRRANSGMDELADKGREFEDAIVGAFMGSVDLADFLLKKISEAALQWALFNSGPWGGGGGGGLLGGLGGLLGGLFANGGVMTSKGPLPLRAYSKGGIARSPQVAVYGEGKMPEAYVPLPDGRSIPVSLDSAAFEKAGAAASRYIEVPYIARVDADDNGKLVARIERVRSEAFASDVQFAQQQQRGLGASINNLNQRGTT